MMNTQSEDFLETLERTHIVLFHDGNDETKKTEYGFIKKRARERRALLLHYTKTSKNPRRDESTWNQGWRKK